LGVGRLVSQDIYRQVRMNDEFDGGRIIQVSRGHSGCGTAVAKIGGASTNFRDGPSQVRLACLLVDKASSQCEEVIRTALQS
jgi:hypothetical protein